VATTSDRLAARLAPQVARLLARVQHQLAAADRKPGTPLFVRTEVLDPGRPDEIRGGVVREDGAAQVTGAWTLDCRDAFGGFLDEAARAGVPLTRVELTRTPTGAAGSWTVGLEQAVTELRVRPARIRFDGLVYRAMIAAAGRLWNGPGEKTLCFEARPGGGPQVTLLSATYRRRLEPPASLLQLLVQVDTLYRAHGRRLTWPEWEVEGVPGDFELQSSLPYRVVAVPGMR
jgi:hypothetical protein